jgi:prepilin-type N-terminal cleavage/methylation domain-containing protein
MWRKGLRRAITSACVSLHVDELVVVLYSFDDEIGTLRNTMDGRRGFTLIELMIVIAIIAIIAGIAIPNLLQSRKGANEAAAVGGLRTLFQAEEMFRDEDMDHDGVLEYATSFQTLVVHGALIDQTLATGTKQGYVYSILEADQFAFQATASPVSPGQSGDRYFFIDDSGALRFNDAQPASSYDRPVGD